MNEKPQLVYFDIRGRAEPIRLLLEDMGAEYEDVQITENDWPNIKPTTPFGRMPVFRDGKHQIPETYAILYFLGRKYDLLGTDEPSRIRCDVTLETIKDFGNRSAAVFGALSGSDSDDRRRAFVEQEAPALISALETFYGQNSSQNGFWAGDSLTIADFSAFNFVEGIENQFPGALASFSQLDGFRKQFAARPRVRDYQTSARRPAALFYGPEGKIYPSKSG
jgi:glutathione S-transferase